MAFGRPVEGEAGPFVGAELSEVEICEVDGTVADARAALERSGGDAVVVVAAGRAVGEVDEAALEGHADDVGLLEVMRPVPSTVRPSVEASGVADAGGGSLLVTDSDGRLLGLASIEPGGEREHQHDHEGHDHEGHDHDEDLDSERYEEELVSVLKAAEERFGGREPSARELRAFLRERLLEEGRSPEEADEMLEALDLGDSG